VFRIFGAESIVENGYHEDNSGTNCTSNALAILASDETQDGRVESGHEVVREGGGEGGGFYSCYESRIGWTYTLCIICVTQSSPPESRGSHV
jgi:hypothetical protein